MRRGRLQGGGEGGSRRMFGILRRSKRHDPLACGTRANPLATTPRLLTRGVEAETPQMVTVMMVMVMVVMMMVVARPRMGAAMRWAVITAAHLAEKDPRGLGLGRGKVLPHYPDLVDLFVLSVRGLVMWVGTPRGPRRGG